MMALFSSDFGLLKEKVRTGLKAWGAQVVPTGNNSLSDEILAIMKAVPSAQRASTNTADALIAGMNRRFPYRG